MYNKVMQLSRENYSQSQIGSMLGIHRDTVRHYQSMTPEEFSARIVREARRHGSRLDPYRDFIVNELRACPSLSSPQVLDHLKEHFRDFPGISDRAMYDYVMSVREDEDIPRVHPSVRQTSKSPETEYGEWAQVDYGEQFMNDRKGRSIKIYFFAMTLSRSRYKFIYLQNVPFTAKTTVYAHHLAFRYFGGIPQKVLYDQDRKMMVKENYGDYILTEEFSKYVAEAGYEAVYAMARDPQTKGRVERVVKYVKYNFLRGRVYINIESLNDEALGWLERTGNGKMHSTTKLIPSEEFQKERLYLKPYKVNMDEPEVEARPYTVRKDNTIMFRSNTYSLPLGTYAPGVKVLVVRNVDLDELEIYDSAFSLITRHKISHETGQFVSKDGHTTSKTRDILESEKLLRMHLNEWNDDTPLSRLLRRISEDRPRYYAKSVKTISSLLTDYDKPTADTLIDIYLEKGILNAGRMVEIARELVKRTECDAKPQEKVVPIPNDFTYMDITPERSSMDRIKEVLNGKKEAGNE